MRHHLSLRRTTIAAVCLTTALTACGSAHDIAGSGKATTGKPDAAPKDPFTGMSGGEIAGKAIKTSSNAKSLRIAGKATDKKTGLDSVDMAFDSTGTCAGSIGTAGKGWMKLIITGGAVYRNYDEGLLRTAGKAESAGAADIEAAVDLLAGRWAKTSATSAEGKSYAKFCDRKAQFLRYKDVVTAARKGGTTTVDGAPVIRLVGSVGKEKYTLYVATKGKPYLVKINREIGGKPETLTFSDFDKPVKAEPPTGDVVDLDRPQR